MKFIKKIMIFGLLITVITVIPVFASYSPNWYQIDDNWRIKDSNGNDIVNRNIQDDNGTYLIDANGNMVTGFVKVFGDWKFYETTPGNDYGKLRIKSGYYNGIYLDMVIGVSGIIQNVDESIVGNFTEVNPQGIVFTNELLPPSNNSTVPSNSNFTQILDNNLLDGATAVALGRQLGVAKGLRIEELGYKGHGIIVHGDMGDFVSINDDYPNIICSFVNAKNRNWVHSQQQRTIKNIQEAIKRLAKF